MLTPSLTEEEKRVAKFLLDSGERNQDVHALINTGRSPTVNFGRISDVKLSNIHSASASDVARYKLEKSLVDLRTGLSPFQHERLVRAREAMMLAIQIFNMPLLRFKIEVFSVLSNIAWTYALHEHYCRMDVPIVHKDGSSLLLSQMIRRQDVPISRGVVQNLQAMKIIRDAVEHKTLKSTGESFYGIFQANCLNFESAICKLFGKKVSLGAELSYAIQVSKMAMDQASLLQAAEEVGPVRAIDAQLEALFSEEDMADPDFMFKVSYTLEKSSKGESHFSFSNNLGNVTPHSVLVKKVASDEEWPHRASDVVGIVAERTQKRFTSHNHVQAWRAFKARPRSNSNDPSNTVAKYCMYHATHKDYTYSEEWVDHLTRA